MVKQMNPEVIGNATLYLGDALEVLKQLPDESVHCCVTSPPYWNLRDYGVKGQMGLEKTPQEYIANMVEVFREVRRVLRSHCTAWVNMGDNYAGSWGAQGQTPDPEKMNRYQINASPDVLSGAGSLKNLGGLKRKDMMGMPWRLAFALQDDGWYLRQDIIWHKPTAMPESVKDRCTKAHEYIFLLSKSEKYYYDWEAIKEPVTGNAHARGNGVNPKAVAGRDNGPGDHSTIDHNKPRHQVRPGPKDDGRKEQGLKDSTKFGRGAGWRNKQNESFSGAVNELVDSRNKRSVWTIPSKGYSGAHFATFPPALIEPCILAGCPEGGIVLDTFAGSGTTGEVAAQLGRQSALIELNPEYFELMKARVIDAQRQGRLFA